MAATTKSFARAAILSQLYHEDSEMTSHQIAGQTYLEISTVRKFLNRLVQSGHVAWDKAPPNGVRGQRLCRYWLTTKGRDEAIREIDRVMAAMAMPALVRRRKGGQKS